MQKVFSAVFLSVVIAISLFTVISASTAGGSDESNSALVVTPAEIKWMPSQQLPNIHVAIMDVTPKDWITIHDAAEVTGPICNTVTLAS